MKRYAVIPHRIWRRDDGVTASIYGPLPWTSTDESARWHVESGGWTVFDKETNAIGCEGAPFRNYEDAELYLRRLGQ